MMKAFYFLMVSTFFFLAMGCAAQTPLNHSGNESGTFRQKLDLKVLGVKRSYLLHIPKNYNLNEKLPLVLLIHGAFSTPAKMEKESGFSELSDRENFLVAYPSGAYGVFGLFRHWNAGHCCGKAARDNTDDVGFLAAVIEDICSRMNVDRSRIYMAGFSNGGMLTYFFAAERTDILAAAAPMSAAPGGKASSHHRLWIIPEPKKALPIIIFHGKEDENVPFEGGISPKKGGQREYLSVADAAALWVRNNQCLPDPETEHLSDGAVTRKFWADPAGKNNVVLYSISGWGHKWPGPHFTNELDETDPLKGFDAAEIIWDFFRKHSKR